MKNSNIILSIIIPTYKRSENLIRAIESIFENKLNYEYEIIVVDDNGINTEYQLENEKKLSKYMLLDNFYYLKHDVNKNGAVARNTGIKSANGRYITFLDDDDQFINNRVDEIIEIINEKTPDFLYTGCVFAKNGKIYKYISNNESNKYILIERLLKQDSFFGTGSNLVCRKEIVDEINGFDESFSRHQDIEFAIRMLEKSNKIVPVGSYLIQKNIDDSSNIPSFEKFLNVKEKFLDKYKYIIESFDFNQQKNIYIINYYELLANALLKKDKEEKKKCINMLKSKNIYKFETVMKYKIKNDLGKFKFIQELKKRLKKKEVKK